MFDIKCEVDKDNPDTINVTATVALLHYIRIDFTGEPMEFEENDQRKFIFGELKKGD